MAISRLLRGLKRRLNSLRRELSHWRSRHLLRQRVKRLRYEGNPIRVVIGAGSKNYEGCWLITNLPVLDALNSAHWSHVFPRGSIDRILAEHVIEHWTEDELHLFLRIVQPFLSEQGFIRIAIPDGFHPDPSYIDYVKPGGTGSGADPKDEFDYIYSEVPGGNLSFQVRNCSSADCSDGTWQNAK